MIRFLQACKTQLESLLFPDGLVCPVCNTEALLGEFGVCESCRAKIHRCGVLPSSHHLDGLYANYSYDPCLRPAMHRFKYKKQAWLANFFLQDAALPEQVSFDAIVPVPMHPFKEYRRTYNPAEALALVLQEQLKTVPLRKDLLKKTAMTPSQTTLTAVERADNVKGVFRASQAVAGMSVLLVDDVCTTGSTLTACAAALKAQGARTVYAICACKAQVGDEYLENEFEAED